MTRDDKRFLMTNTLTLVAGVSFNPPPAHHQYVMWQNANTCTYNSDIHNSISEH